MGLRENKGKGKSKKGAPTGVTPGAWGTFVPRKSSNIGGVTQKGPKLPVPPPHTHIHHLPSIRESPLEGREGPGVSLFLASQLSNSAALMACSRTFRWI